MPATARQSSKARSPATPHKNAPGRTVDPGLPTPLYHQIYVLLREQILSGVYADRALVPTEQALSERFGVSRITAKRALDELAAEGLVVRQRGRGTTVVGRLPTRPLTANISGLLENLLMLGLKTNVAIVEFGYLVPSEDVRKALDLPEGSEVQRAVRVRSHDGVPLSYSISFVPAAIGRAYDKRDLATNALLALLERAGILIGSADQTIGAALADTVVAPLLGVRVGSPLLSITRTVFDQNGRPVEHINIRYRPDRYQYRMKLTRVQGRATKLWSTAE